jgi:hypothetical protein
MKPPELINYTSPPKKHRKGLYLCFCKNKFVSRCDSVKSGKTKSCGCIKKITNGKTTKHGHNRKGATTATYKCWSNMLSRCKNKKLPSYKNYGARGITVCERWRVFNNFLFDMGACPIGLQLDRIDNNKGYFKQNCRWATRSENCNNKNNNLRLKHNGKSYTATELARKLSLNENNLIYYLNKYLYE